MGKYKYTKNCRLARCNRVFKTNRKWQEFCHPDHRVEFNREKAKDPQSLKNRVKKLEKDHRQLRELFSSLEIKFKEVEKRKSKAGILQ